VGLLLFFIHYIMIFVIYTNEKQADLAVLQEWIDKIENSSGCLVILACR